MTLEAAAFTNGVRQWSLAHYFVISIIILSQPVKILLLSYIKKKPNYRGSYQIINTIKGL